MAVKTFDGLLTVVLAIPRMFGGWQVGPVLFARQGFPRSFALNLRKEHAAQVVAAVYRIQAAFGLRQLVIDNCEKRMGRSSPTLTLIVTSSRGCFATGTLCSQG